MSDPLFTESPDLIKPVLGWREWMSLPELGVEFIKPKIDTGARSSAIHAYDITEFCDNGRQMVRFVLHPFQDDLTKTVQATAELLEYRHIKSSNGQVTHRPVILTEVAWNGYRWPIELTLTNRDEMGFRMLLGREAIRGRFFVDPGSSYLGGKPFRKLKSKTKKKQKRT